MTTDDMELVRQYAADGSESAFAALVGRHANLVYSASLRLVGDPHLAEEVTQAVFILLSQKAASLDEKTLLSGWLYRAACYAAKSAQKREYRRQRREQEAYMQSTLDENQTQAGWEQMAPILEKAMLRLSQTERDTLVLRFFEGRTLNEVGVAMGASEDAVKKRVDRALDKLRKSFTKKGVVATTTLIAGVISANSVQAAPSALANTLTAAAVAKSAATETSSLALAKGALKLMAWAKAKTAILYSACVLVAGASLLALYEIENPSEGLPKGWIVIDGTAEQWNWADGKINAHSTTFQTILASTNAYRDFTMSAIVNTTNREASFAVRMQDAANGYLVIFAPVTDPYPYGRFVAISRCVEGHEYRLGSYSGRLIPAEGEPTRLGVIADKAWLHLTLNGTTVLRIKDTTYESGLIGLRIFGDGAYPCDATFSNLTFSGTPMNGKHLVADLRNATLKQP